MVWVSAGSNRMRVAIIILGVLLCSAATAEPQPWMKKENPDTLHYIAGVTSECPISELDIRVIVNGILIRSRLRPGEYFSSPETLGFWVEIN